jgi:hypothetical protein
MSFWAILSGQHVAAAMRSFEFVTREVLPALRA